MFGNLTFARGRPACSGTAGRAGPSAWGKSAGLIKWGGVHIYKGAKHVLEAAQAAAAKEREAAEELLAERESAHKLAEGAQPASPSMDESLRWQVRQASLRMVAGACFRILWAACLTALSHVCMPWHHKCQACHSGRRMRHIWAC